jgi:transcriptional regulator with XRE-family HTH domain
MTLRDGHELSGRARENLLEEAIGRQLKEFRRANGLSAADLARASGTSVGMISKIENGQISPSLSTLQRLSAALNVPVTALFRQFEEHRSASFVPAGQGLTIERRGTRAGHQYQLLGHGVRGAVDIEPYLITLTEQSDVFPLFQHEGVEFIHMLEGEVDYRHGDTIYPLKPGDSLLFDPEAAHGPENLKRLPIRFLAVISYRS